MKKNGILHRISTAVLAGAMLLSLASCGASSSQTASSAAGKVTGTGSAKGIEGDVVVEVTADADTIYSIVVTEQNETQGIGSVACEQLPDAMVAANSYNVDGIAGATVTSDALKEAVKAALENAGLDASAFAVAKAADTTVEKTAETLDCDVVVVGAGGAGLTAAAQAAETLLWSLQDAGHTDTTNALGKVTIQTTELTEHLRKGSEEYDRLTRTVTESGKEMVNGVVKNYKTVTKYVTENGKTTAQTQKTYEEIAATVRDTVTSTFDSVVDGVRTSTQTVTETLTDETTQQKQTITKTCTDIVNGMLVTKEQVETIAADGARTTAETIKEASANTFSGLLKGWQDEADKGVVGTFNTLVNAVKKQDWQSVGEWVLSTLYNGLAPQAKQLIDDFGKNLIQQVNGLLGKGVSAVSNGLWDMGGDLAKGLTSGFADVLTQAQGLGTTLTGIFQGLKGPLTAAAAAISTGLKGGLISSFPEILASMGTLIGSIGSAFVGMLEAVAAALFPTGFGAPQALLMIAAGVALTAAIAAIVAGVGGAFKRKTTPGISGGTSGSSTTSTALREARPAAAAHPAAQHRGQPVHLFQGADGCRPDARGTVRAGKGGAAGCLTRSSRPATA